MTLKGLPVDLALLMLSRALRRDLGVVVEKAGFRTLESVIENLTEGPLHVRSGKLLRGLRVQRKELAFRISNAVLAPHGAPYGTLQEQGYQQRAGQVFYDTWMGRTGWWTTHGGFFRKPWAQPAWEANRDQFGLEANEAIARALR
jgi:hypothetical protein